jgi:hypothetical protein
VDVTNGERAGWLALGEAEHGASTRFDEVLDQGRVWIIRFADGEGGETRLPRATTPWCQDRGVWPVDTDVLDGPVLRRLVAALGPTVLRVGGTGANGAWFCPSGTARQPPANYVTCSPTTTRRPRSSPIALVRLLQGRNDDALEVVASGRGIDRVA